MPYSNIDPYRRSPTPLIEEGRARWLEEELRKLEITIQQLLQVIKELQAKVP